MSSRLSEDETAELLAKMNKLQKIFLSPQTDNCLMDVICKKK